MYHLIANKKNKKQKHKRSVVRSLTHRIGGVETEDQKKEKVHINKVLRDNGYKDWMFKTTKKRKPVESNTDTIKSFAFKLPYIRGVSEQLACIYKQHGVNTFFKPINTLREILVHPKDKTPNCRKCGVIYSVKCEECSKQYIGETARTLETRLKEHNRKVGNLTAIGEHLVETGHKIDKDKVTIIGREDKFWRRKIHESVKIREHKPPLNRDFGYQLPAIYNSLLRPPTTPRCVAKGGRLGYNNNNQQTL